MFDSTKKDLKDMLKDIDAGHLQLPDFQRDYIWDDDDVRNLIGSVAKGYPIGALLTLQTGGQVDFRPRLIAGVDAKNVKPVELLLDGQQRMTSLFQTMYSKRPTQTKTSRNTKIQRYYYINIKKALEAEADIGDAIIGVPEDKIVRSNFGKTIELDVSTRESEFQNDLFPLNQAFDSRDWFFEWRDYWKDNGRESEVNILDRDFYKGVLERIERYEMPIIKLDKDNSREAICLVFEKVNVGGKKLDAFELLTAVYAAHKFDLREDWGGSQEPPKPGRRANMIGSPNRRDVLTKTASTDFLQACTLLYSREQRLAKANQGAPSSDLPQVTCRRNALLALPLEAYRKHADSVEQGFIEASNFLNELKIIWNRDVPYPPQVMALASTFAILGHGAETHAAKEKLALWFWNVTFGELYGSATDTRIARDVPQLVDWISGTGDKPRSIDEALFQRSRLRSLQIRISAAYKGLHALLMQNGCLDFITGKPTDIMTFFVENIDIHHVFPRDWCNKQRIPEKVFNSIINKTPLSKRSNIIIGGRAPSEYLKRIEQQQGLDPEALDQILRTHLIEPEHLRNDDFEAFYEARQSSLVSLVANAMGKAVVEDQGTNEQEVDADPEVEDVEPEEVA
ncbi:MAG: DUF262 domain-containing protein [Dehalococcoidia bacterium]|nr:DUF262 domain-containing protein [Dehalococcoidia bacterium]